MAVDSVQYRGAVVITGASSGIGHDATLALARNGWLVFAGVRRDVDRQALGTQAGAIGLGDHIVPLLLDVTDYEMIASCCQHVDMVLVEKNLRLAAIVNNAGLAVAGPVEEVPLDRLRAILETNVVGAAAMVQAFLPRLRADGGRIINMSSVSGRVASPYLGAYAASKFALEALSDSLRRELRPWKIHVILIEPGPITTPIWEKSDAAARVDRTLVRVDSPYAAIVPQVCERMRQSGRDGLPTARVSEAILFALTAQHPRARYLVTRHPFQFELFARCCPEWLRDWLFSRAFR